MEYEKIMGQAKAAKSGEEILALAKENEIEMTETEAEETFNILNKTGELSDEELENVSGGGCKTEVGGKKYTVVTSALGCMNGQYENNWKDSGYVDWYGEKIHVLAYAKDHKSLRSTWRTHSRDGQCGYCRWLSFKGGLGYCSKSAE